MTTRSAQRKVTILGATGSIGASTLDVIAQHPDRFVVTALAANRQWQALLELVARFRPAYAALTVIEKALARYQALKPELLNAKHD